MKRIETIYHKNIDDFDVEVNSKIEDGWTLTWRAVQVVNGDIHLFAGMEKDVVTEKEKAAQDRDCSNCKHMHKRLKDEPCRFCDDNDNWEAKE